MQRVSTTLAAVAIAALTLTTWAARGAEKEEGWVPLFNGKDLAGWKTHPSEPGKWTVEDGILIGRGKDRSHLFSERGDYENFHYRIEAKISDKGNSGQYFRTQFGPGYPKGYEAQINATHPDPQKTGSLYAKVKQLEILAPADMWFTQEVIANGNKITIKVNGKTTAEYTDESKDAFAKGHFAIQQHSPAKGSDESIIMVKKIEVKELK